MNPYIESGITGCPDRTVSYSNLSICRISMLQNDIVNIVSLIYSNRQSAQNIQICQSK